jgi:hypothetical protein
MTLMIGRAIVGRNSTPHRMPKPIIHHVIFACPDGRQLIPRCYRSLPSGEKIYPAPRTVRMIDG